MTKFHGRFKCDDPDWCNYGLPEPSEFDPWPDDAPWPEQQELARKHLRYMRNCGSAVLYENDNYQGPKVHFGNGEPSCYSKAFGKLWTGTIRTGNRLTRLLIASRRAVRNTLTTLSGL